MTDSKDGDIEPGESTGGEQPAEEAKSTQPTEPVKRDAAQPTEPVKRDPEQVTEPVTRGQEDTTEPVRKRGSIRKQDAETTVPREPTLAEKRAMRRAMEENRERDRAEVAEAERKSLVKRRVMIGAGVTVGLVATVAIWYSAATPNEVNAYCVDKNDTLSSDENICSDSYVRSHGGYSSGGFYYIPIGIGQPGYPGYNTYHYNYGGSVSSGSGGVRRVTGGSTAAPSSGTTIKSGTSGSTIQRGGFGVSGGGKSGGS